jgi:hypothetical protein
MDSRDAQLQVIELILQKLRRNFASHGIEVGYTRERAVKSNHQALDHEVLYGEATSQICLFGSAGKAEAALILR